MTLHEAIIEVIKKLGPTKAKQIAWIINHSKLYQKKDYSEVETVQIYARVHRYPNLLYVNDAKRVCIK